MIYFGEPYLPLWYMDHFRRTIKFSRLPKLLRYLGESTEHRVASNKLEECIVIGADALILADRSKKFLYPSTSGMPSIWMINALHNTSIHSPYYRQVKFKKSKTEYTVELIDKQLKMRKEAFERYSWLMRVNQGLISEKDKGVRDGYVTI